MQAGRGAGAPGWPGGAKAAVAISFDFDNETAALCLNRTSPAYISQAHYGARVGLPRIMPLLKEFDVRASFFVPAVSMRLAPDAIEAVRGQGHEVGLHGWIHERCGDLSEAEEYELAGRSAEVLRHCTGLTPRGMRTPWWDFTEHTLPIARQWGMLYDSSMMADDEPYELLDDGERTGIVEIPVAWIRDDAPYFPDDPADRQILAPRDVLRIWEDEFDGAFAEGGIFQLTLHPHVIGHRSRMLILRELLRHIADRSGVWFATHEEVARHIGGQIGIAAPSADGLSA
ncbi:polysaccharide deacetylase family protein [Streptomyces tsukubensis]|uniref:polysaccharide deacetylase family protein n=1 Tax=Streptomyces tsukubensis TaxID=83656 RepID=UPI001D0503D5|nr:polysaccharide deacetylase [Streptomyces tsukubensis]